MILRLSAVSFQLLRTTPKRFRTAHHRIFIRFPSSRYLSVYDPTTTTTTTAATNNNNKADQLAAPNVMSFSSRRRNYLLVSTVHISSLSCNRCELLLQGFDRWTAHPFFKKRPPIDGMGSLNGTSLYFPRPECRISATIRRHRQLTAI
jgi:hypothetical protein